MIDADSRFFVGRVTSSDTATYAVQVEATSTIRNAVVQGIPLATVFATTLGFKECPQYPVGAVVLCYHTGASGCYIIGIVPPNDYGAGDTLRFFSRTALKTADGNNDLQNIQGYNSKASKLGTHNQNRPTDVVEGEHVISNEFGVLLGLFQEMANLKGSELSQVQCYLLDDLVRIISHNYEHLSAMGEFKICHDGKAIIAEFGATHLSQESLGIPQVESVRNEPIFEDVKTATKDDSLDYYEFTQDEKIKAIERLKIFLGRLGDFLHVFLVRPDPEAIRTLSGALNGKFDKGLFDAHIAEDGKLSVRSVTGITLEKTNWIMVPHRVRTPEDPNGDLEDDINFDEKDPFEFDNTHKWKENPTAYFLQLRDCNAYLQDLYNYKNFFKYNKDFKFSKGPQNNETQLEEINKVDIKTPVKFKDYKLRRSGIYLMENGGIMLKEACGAALILEGGCIYLQPVKDLVAQPLRNFIVKAGQFTSIAAKKDVDISSTEEGFRLKTKKVQHFYSHEEGIIIQSDSESLNEPTPEEQAYNKFGGILLKAKKGIYQYAERIFDRAEEKALYKAGKLTFESVEKLLTIKSTDSIVLLSERDLNMLSKGNVNLVGEQSVQVVGESTNIGKKDKIVGMVPHPNSMPAILDGVLDLDMYKDIIAAYSDMDPQMEMSPFNEDEKFTKIKFRFLDSVKYKLGSSNEDFIPMTLGQQDDEMFDLFKLKDWQEIEIESTLPFPGKDKFDDYFVTAKLQNLKKVNGDLFSIDSEGLQSKALPLKNESLQKYKVLEK